MNDDWQKRLDFVQDCGGEGVAVMPTLFMTGWETVIFELEDTNTTLDVALGELRAAIAEAERLVETWEL